MTPPTSITIGPSVFKVLGKLVILSIAITALVAVLVVLVGFVAVPWLFIHAETIIAGTAVGFACYCGMAALGTIIWGRPRIEIGPECFADYGIVGHRSRRWCDIEGDFTVIIVSLQAVVAYRLTDAFKASTRIQLVASLAGNDEAILVSGELEIGARELAEMLNQWKQRAPSRDDIL